MYRIAKCTHLKYNQLTIFRIKINILYMYIVHTADMYFTSVFELGY